jgi:glyoxylase-like metal-dependent hydrolase (beta-lactamase superfamily II)
MLAAIKEVTDEPVTHVVYSHWHADHIGAAAVYGSKVKTIAHEKTRELLERWPDPNRPVPTETFAKDATLEVNGVKMELSYKGQNHCEGNIFIYAPKQKVLAAIDIFAPGWVPFKRPGQNPGMRIAPRPRSPTAGGSCRGDYTHAGRVL